MKFSLVIIGAHDGHKTVKLVANARKRGPALLVEPVPHLFSKLEEKYGNTPDVVLMNKCLASHDGVVDFYAPTQEASQKNLDGYGDQLGSMEPTHAEKHGKKFAALTEKLIVPCIKWETLLDDSQCEEIDFLFTDTEGYDARLLAAFPFHRLHPRQIAFEYKHSDGTFNLGKNLGSLLIRLDSLNYHVRVVDPENMYAQKRSLAAA